MFPSSPRRSVSVPSCDQLNITSPVQPKRSRSKSLTRPCADVTDTNGSSGIKQYRVVVLGSCGVGKTSLLGQFLNGSFSHKYNPTVGDCFKHLFKAPDGSFHCIDILDTAGLQEFPAMRRLFIQSGQAFIVVFSLTDSKSFNDAIDLMDCVKQEKGGDTITMALVGNKTDMLAVRQVTEQDAQQLAAKHNCQYIEVSAKNEPEVRKLFVELLLRALPSSPKHNSGRRRSSIFSRKNEIITSNCDNFGINDIRQNGLSRRLDNDSSKQCCIL